MATSSPLENGHKERIPSEVIDIARSSETLEEFVVYRALYGENGLWIRPLKMFLEMVEVNGRVLERFQFVENDQNS